MSCIKTFFQVDSLERYVLWLKYGTGFAVLAVCAQGSHTMISSPFSFMPPLLQLFLVHSLAFQLGSEAMVETPPSASSLRGSKAADSVAGASEGPWLSQVGHRKLVHDNMMGSQEIGRSNGFPLQDSNPRREKSRPPYIGTGS